MARKCGEQQLLPLTQEDREYAQDLLEWSRTIQDHKLTWEQWEKIPSIWKREK